VACRSIDVDVPRPEAPEATATLARRLVDEMLTGQPEPVLAYRGGHRWVQSAEPTPLSPANGASPLRERGVYLITGGLGGIGVVFARHLAERWKARLVLTGRSALPPREEWERVAASGDKAAAERVREMQRLEGLGAEVLYVAADVARREEMREVIARARERFGPVQGVIHSAGVAGGGLIQLKEPEVVERVFSPKVKGTLVLEEALRDEPLDFLLLCSSTAAYLGGFGQIDYCAANAFLDAYAHRARPEGGPLVISVNWDAWKEVGMAVNTAVSGAMQAAREWTLKVAITPEEGVDALGRILAARLPQVAVSTMDMRPALFQAHWRRKLLKTPLDEAPAVAAPADAAAAVAAPAAGSDLERMVIESWERILGRNKIGASDNFFELGGDSLSALQVIALLKARLGRDIPVVTFYEAPTVALLARALADGAAEKPVALEEIEQRAGTRLELMQRRRQKRVQPSLDAAR
jgi:NAD(P)-dependent dehydrogenase (short-subunit alcohol dehydrogenase family)/acyl carrier protein